MSIQFYLFTFPPHSTITEKRLSMIRKVRPIFGYSNPVAIQSSSCVVACHWQVAQLDSHASNYFLWIAALRVHRFSNFGSINPENYDVLTRVLLRGVVVFLGECQIIQYSCHNGVYKSELRARWFYLVCDSRRRMTWTIHPWVESFFTE